MYRIAIPDPFSFPLEVRPERDLRRLCSKCARGFGACIAEEYDGLRWVAVPEVWRALTSADAREENAVAEDDSLERKEAGID